MEPKPGEPETTASPATLAHHRRAMSGRDVNEAHRVSSPLELLFDLTFVAGFAVAAQQLAHGVAEAHFLPALSAYAFVMFSICWAWMNFSWFASAYDTDDWAFRAANMLHMVGVIVLALGIVPLFQSIEAGGALDRRVLVFGYVIMRLVLVFLIFRAARDDAARRRTLLRLALTLVVVQALWTLSLVLTLPPAWAFAFGILLMGLEMALPLLAFRDNGLPWHAHHIAERFGLLAIIAFGEVITGTVAMASSIVQSHGWSVGVLMTTLSGVCIAVGMWWIYFLIPSGEVLHQQRRKLGGWSVLHIVLYGAIAAVGAGLHVVGLLLEGKAHLSVVAAVTALAVPIGLFVLMIYVIYYWLLPYVDLLHTVLVTLTLAALGTAIAMAYAGFSLVTCLAMLMLAPLVTVAGYELVGYRYVAARRQGLSGRH